MRKQMSILKKATVTASLAVAASCFALNNTAHAATVSVDITNPGSFGGTYDPRGGTLDRMQASYNDQTDVFRFRYEFTGDTNLNLGGNYADQLGDGYFKFTDDGNLPNGNGGITAPWYLVDADSGILKIKNENGTVSSGNVDYSYDQLTGEGYVEIWHDVSDVRDVLGTTPNWDGGAFTEGFGIWSHIVDINYIPAFNDPRLTQNWIAFDPEAGSLNSLIVVSEIPLPAAAWLFGSALLGLGTVKRRNA